MDILNEYVTHEPSSQNVLDIFKGEWSSRLPDSLNLETSPGTARLFEDDRVVWAEEVFGPFTDWDILELGPLEGGHSYMLQMRGARNVVAVEANKRAFLKCLCVKEILNLNKVTFKLGDFLPFMRNNSSKFDMIFASGVLYHLEEPIELVKSASKLSDRIFIWTHYYDKNILSKNKNLSHKFKRVSSFKYDGVLYEYSTQSYKKALDWVGFCGGSKPVSKWLTKESVIKALRQYGFNDIQISFEHPDHPNGPAFALCAKK